MSHHQLLTDAVIADRLREAEAARRRTAPGVRRRGVRPIRRRRALRRPRTA